VCASYVGSTVRVCNMASGERGDGELVEGGDAKWGSTSGICVL